MAISQTSIIAIIFVFAFLGTIGLLVGGLRSVGWVVRLTFLLILPFKKAHANFQLLCRQPECTNALSPLVFFADDFQGAMLRLREMPSPLLALGTRPPRQLFDTEYFLPFPTFRLDLSFNHEHSNGI